MQLPVNLPAGETAMRLAVAATVFAVAAGPVSAQSGAEFTAQERRGEALLTRLCADCHAVGRSDVSAAPNAPPFRTLGSRYKIEALEEALAEGRIDCAVHSMKDVPALLPNSAASNDPRRLYETIRAAARPGPLEDDYSALVLRFP